MTRKSLSFIILLVLILAGCQAASAPTESSQVSPIPSRPFHTPTLSRTPHPVFTPYLSKTPTLAPTPFPTFTISPTSTLQPPLVEHTWQPETVLISFYETHGDGGADYPFTIKPSFLLLADGRLFVSHYDLETGEYSILTRQLNRREICQHLNTLDQIGYLDYDPATYQFVGGSPSILGAPGNIITVNTWSMAQENSYYELSRYMDGGRYGPSIGLDPNDPNGRPVVSPALRDTYYFLSRYPSAGLQKYDPTRLALLIYQTKKPSNDSSVTLSKWLLQNPTLAELFAEGGSSFSDNIHRALVLKGATAQSVYDALGRYPSVSGYFYEENDGVEQYYHLSVDALMPYESPEGDDMYLAQIPAPGTENPNFTLTCYPSDGILPIPTPSNP